MPERLSSGTQKALERNYPSPAAPAFFSFTCSDGLVVFAPGELQVFCRAGNVIGGLIHGSQGGIGTSHPPKVEIFSAWPSRVLNLLRACVRNGRLPSDARARELIQSGELREFADAFGGFAIVDTLLAEVDRRTEEGRQVQTPAEDTAGLFEWRVVGPVRQNAQDRYENGMYYVIEFSTKGYEMAGKEADENNHLFYHMRKRRRLDVHTRVSPSSGK